MSTDTDIDTFDSGIVTLSADSIDQFQDQAPWTVSGVAIPVNTVVRGGQGVDHFYPESVLEESAELLEGQPIVSGYHSLDGQADPEHVVGEITSSGYQEGVGLVYEGEVIEPDVAKKISQEYLECSPTPARSLGEYDESKGAQRVERVSGFRDLAIVVSGQPGNEITVGPNPAVEALAQYRVRDGFEALGSDKDPADKTNFAEAPTEVREKREAFLDVLERRGLDDRARQERAKLTTLETDTTMTTNTTSSELDSLSAEERQDVKDKLEKADKMERRTPKYADTLRSKAADIAGVDSHEEIEVDAL